MRAWGATLGSLAALYGAVGVGLAAVGAHVGGGALATTASSFLLFHAAALVGLVACAAERRRVAPLMVAASTIALGTLLFSTHLAVHALTGLVPVPKAAPVGGSLTIAGWLVAAVALPLALVGPRRPS